MPRPAKTTIEAMNVQKKTMSREELYQMLWKSPISRLTAELGYSYVELVKTLDPVEYTPPDGWLLVPTSAWWNIRTGTFATRSRGHEI